MDTVQIPLVADKRPFPQAFQHFWRTGSGAFMLGALRESGGVGCAAVAGWTRGGCLVWAEGVRRWMTSSASAAGLNIELVAVQTDETEAAHVLVALGYTDDDLLYVDALGVWTPQQLSGRLEREYAYDAPVLLPWRQIALERVRIPFDERVVQQIEDGLTQMLGPYRHSSVFAPVGVLVA